MMTATKSLLKESVILVDADDQEIGTADKLSAHANNLLHRAFSVFIFRSDGALLLQQRALHKYHSPGLWTNTCCSHPRLKESILSAASRRLYEELGISCELKQLGWFHYNAHFANGLSENEIDHVLVGTIPETIPIKPNQEEVHAYRWVPLNQLARELELQPETFTPWFKAALKIAIEYVP